MDFVLISRKDVRRLGRRFICRGLNEEGNSANFVETEQILIGRANNIKDSKELIVASYVQIRGSIPLLWSQSPYLCWAPRVYIYIYCRLLSKMITIGV